MKLKSLTLLILLLTIVFVYGETGATALIKRDTGKFKESVDFGIKSGIFLPVDKLISDVYGEGITYGVDVSAWLRDGFGLGLSIQQYRAFAEFPTEEIEESQISIVPAMISILIKDRNLSSEFKPYFGIGIGIVNVDEKCKTDNDNYTANDTNIGFASTIGIKAEHVFLELKITSARIEMNGVSGWDHDFNAGGVSICGGFSF